MVAVSFLSCSSPSLIDLKSDVLEFDELMFCEMFLFIKCYFKLLPKFPDFLKLASKFFCCFDILRNILSVFSPVCLTQDTLKNFRPF